MLKIATFVFMKMRVYLCNSCICWRCGVDKEKDTNGDHADGFILMRETFGNKEDLKVFNDNGNWAIEKEEDGNLV